MKVALFWALATVTLVAGLAVAVLPAPRWQARALAFMLAAVAGLWALGGAGLAALFFLPVLAMGQLALELHWRRLPTAPPPESRRFPMPLLVLAAPLVLLVTGKLLKTLWLHRSLRWGLLAGGDLYLALAASLLLLGLGGMVVRGPARAGLAPAGVACGGGLLALGTTGAWPADGSGQPAVAVAGALVWFFVVAAIWLGSSARSDAVALARGGE